jgi:hypothetical protein
MYDVGILLPYPDLVYCSPSFCQGNRTCLLGISLRSCLAVIMVCYTFPLQESQLNCSAKSACLVDCNTICIVLFCDSVKINRLALVDIVAIVGHDPRH